MWQEFLIFNSKYFWHKAHSNILFHVETCQTFEEKYDLSRLREIPPQNNQKREREQYLETKRDFFLQRYAVACATS